MKMRQSRYHPYSINTVAFSPDGTRLVSGSHDDFTLRLWDIPSCAEVAFMGPPAIFSGVPPKTEFFRLQAEFSPCGSYLLILGDIWDIRSLPPSLLSRTNPVVAGRSFSRVSYNWATSMIEAHMSSLSTFPVPGCQVWTWIAQGGRIALGLTDGRVVIVDCTHLL